MKINLYATEEHPIGGENSTDPVALPWWSSLVVLLVLAGVSLLLPRALPDYSRTAHSGLSNWGF